MADTTIGAHPTFVPVVERRIKMDAMKRAGEMMSIPMKDVPPLALKFAKKLCQKYGGCGEVVLTAYAAYAQSVEGLSCDDDLYQVGEEDRQWFKEELANGTGI
jgi:hypothetical protein